VGHRPSRVARSPALRGAPAAAPRGRGRPENVRRRSARPPPCPPPHPPASRHCSDSPPPTLDGIALRRPELGALPGTSRRRRPRPFALRRAARSRYSRHVELSCASFYLSRPHRCSPLTCVSSGLVRAWRAQQGGDGCGTYVGAQSGEIPNLTVVTNAHVRLGYLWLRWYVCACRRARRQGVTPGCGGQGRQRRRGYLCE
jgi:hypothetical protein